jgi:voltage-gated potassium channel Kch
VLETGHTLILGWSARLPVIISELAIANENVSRAAIVILARRDKTEMEVEVRDRVGDARTTKIVCRSGNPAKPADLQLANIGAAPSVIVLTGDEGDAGVVKAILAVKTLDPDFSHVNVVAELAHAAHATTIKAITEGGVTTVNSDDVIAEVTAQACHQSGLAVVFRELLDFEGDECYFASVPELVGHSYAEALLAFDTSSVLGRYSADGQVQLNPAPDTIFAAGDQVIALSADDDTIIFTGIKDVACTEPASPYQGGEPPIRVLIVGWSGFGPKVLNELDEFLAAGSHLEICVDPSLADITGLDEIRLAHATLRISRTSGGPERLISYASAERFDQVIVLGYRDALTIDDADSHTLLSLLTLRKVWPADSNPPVRMIAQLLDQSNAELAAATGVDDFIVSDALASLMIAQLSERAELQLVFDDLFNPTGAVIELRPAHRFVHDAPVRYDEAVAAGTLQAVSVLGWRIDTTGEVVINPSKSTRVHLGAGDELLLIGVRSH